MSFNRNDNRYKSIGHALGFNSVSSRKNGCFVYFLGTLETVQKANDREEEIQCDEFGSFYPLSTIQHARDARVRVGLVHFLLFC